MRLSRGIEESLGGMRVMGGVGGGRHPLIRRHLSEFAIDFGWIIVSN